MVGARRRDVERHSRRGDLDVACEIPVEHLVHPIVRVGNVAVERHGHDRDYLAHRAAPLPAVALAWPSASGSVSDAAAAPKSSVTCPLPPRFGLPWRL